MRQYGLCLDVCVCECVRAFMCVCPWTVSAHVHVWLGSTSQRSKSLEDLCSGDMYISFCVCVCLCVSTEATTITSQ